MNIDLEFRKIKVMNEDTRLATYMSPRNCPLCGENKFSKIHSYENMQFFTDHNELSKIVEINDCMCENCYLMYKNPCFTQNGFEVLFEEAGATYGATEGRQEEQVRWLSDRGLLSAGLCFLDVGCYDGAFLSSLPADLTRMGVDIDKPAVLRGTIRDPSLLLTCGSFENFTPNNPPDVMVMFHVLEHVTNPIGVLKRLRQVCAENGVLVIEVPIAENGQTNDINGFFSTQHLTHFTKHTLKQNLRLAGWSITEANEMEGYNGYRVVCKPSEAMSTSAIEKSEQDLEILNKVLESTRVTNDEINKILGSLPASGDILIWGGGMHTEVLYHRTDLFRHPERRFHIIDSDEMKIGKSWRGVPISSSNLVNNIDWRKFDGNLVLSSYQHQWEMEQLAIHNGCSADKIVKLYSVTHSY